MQTSTSAPRLPLAEEAYGHGTPEYQEQRALEQQRNPPRPRRAISLDHPPAAHPPAHPPAQPPLKDRLYTALTRFRYGWNLRSSVEISAEEPIWLLGCCYHQDNETARANQDVEGAPPHILGFMDHFNSLIWMTYRTNFPALPGTTISTDCGWGCMVRSGQMILATTLNRFLLGSEWRLRGSNKEQRTMHRKILSWFADSPGPECPFSLHALMRVAVRLGHRPGDWFGPSQLAILTRECVMESRKTQPLLENLLVYVAHDCTVYIGDVMKLYGEEEDRALMLLVPVRLGSEALNPIYIPCVKSLLALDHCVGIIGGKPKHSVYFVGFQKNKLVHLDPHYCQVATEPGEEPHYRNFDIKTYHCSTPRKLAASRMDPSCTIGFLCRNLQEFHALRKEAEKVLAPPLQKGVYPFFSFSELSLEEMLESSVNMRLGSLAEDTFMFAEGEKKTSPKGRGKRKRKSSSKRGSDMLDGVVLNDEEDFVVVECRPSLKEGEEEEEEEGTLTGSSSQDSDGEMVFLTKSDTLSSGVETSGTVNTLASSGNAEGINGTVVSESRDNHFSPPLEVGGERTTPTTGPSLEAKVVTTPTNPSPEAGEGDEATPLTVSEQFQDTDNELDSGEMVRTL